METGNFYFFGLIPVPIVFAPISSLVIIKIFVPQSSFIGHISGIIIGYFIQFGLYLWFSNFLFGLILPW